MDGAWLGAWFARTHADGTIERRFDMPHALPPQVASGFLRVSPLADAAGWANMDPATLRHERHARLHGLGDAGDAPSAETAAAARKQAPIVAHNLPVDMGVLKQRAARCDGYGSCPPTVERGRAVLAEFGHGGKLLPCFPSWPIDGRTPSRLAWLLEERMLPWIYWKVLLRDRERFAKPDPATW